MTRVGDYEANNFRVKTFIKEDYTAQRNAGVQYPRRFSCLRRENEEITKLDIAISCLIQGVLEGTSLAVDFGIRCYFHPKKFFATPMTDFKNGLCDQWALTYGACMSLREPIETPWFLKDWKDHFTMLAAFTPGARDRYVLFTLKNLAIRSALLGTALYFTYRYEPTTHGKILNLVVLHIKGFAERSPFNSIGYHITCRLGADLTRAARIRFT